MSIVDIEIEEVLNIWSIISGRPIATHFAQSVELWHHQRRTTEICSINVGCIDEIDYHRFNDVPMNNGVDGASGKLILGNGLPSHLSHLYTIG